MAQPGFWLATTFIHRNLRHVAEKILLHCEVDPFYQHRRNSFMDISRVPGAGIEQEILGRHWTAQCNVDHQHSLLQRILWVYFHFLQKLQKNINNGLR